MHYKSINTFLKNPQTVSNLAQHHPEKPKKSVQSVKSVAIINV